MQYIVVELFTYQVIYSCIRQVKYYKYKINV